MKKYAKADNSLWSPCLGCKDQCYHSSGYCKKCRDAMKAKEKNKLHKTRL